MCLPALGADLARSLVAQLGAIETIDNLCDFFVDVSETVPEAPQLGAQNIALAESLFGLYNRRVLLAYDTMDFLEVQTERRTITHTTHFLFCCFFLC